jgi:hypothetical protein
MNSRLLTVSLSIAVFLAVIVFLGSYSNTFRLPGNHEGFEPAQPIVFSHRLHAGELRIACLHCHSDAEQSRHAGIPAVATCLNCHRFVTAPFVDMKAEDEHAARENRTPRRIVSPEIRKILDAAGLDVELKPVPARRTEPIRWVRVHSLPDFVSFHHSAHVNAGVECQDCHGQVETMERVRQVSDLSMGMCVNCHREANARGVRGKPANASTDCAVCHY